jgi:hypothetical protein
MTTSHSPVAASPSSSSGESFSSLPRWRQFLSTLNWRRDPGYELRMQQSEWRTKQIEIEILRVRSDSERIRKETEQIKKETEQIKKETEQLRLENVKLRMLNAKTKTLLSYVDQHCFPPESNSTPIPPIEPGSSSS